MPPQETTDQKNPPFRTWTKNQLLRDQALTAPGTLAGHEGQFVLRTDPLHLAKANETDW